MQLTLKVIRSPETLLPEPRRVAETELNIGRGPENDWVLSDPNRHLSKRHCTLALRAGRWSVTDRSTNGTFVNRDIQPLGDGQTRNLRDGDRLRVGLYEIEVRIIDEETLQGRHTAWITQAGIDTPNHDPFGKDPFGNDPFGDTPPAGETGADHLVSTSVPAGPDATLPQDEFARPLRTAPSRPTAGLMAEEPDTAIMPRSEPPPQAPQVPWDAGVSHPLETVSFPVPPPRSELLAAFLRGVGMPDAIPADPVAVMEALGTTFSALVVGLREVMITRAKIKGEFRIEQTLMRSHGNNPLKFSADDHDALAALLGIGRRIEMKPADAVTAALRDMQTHETATIAGMRAGLRAVLLRIDPDRLAAAAESAGPAGLSAQGKVRAWDAFVRQHAEIAASAPDDFDGIFGRAFARGYEQSLKDME